MRSKSLQGDIEKVRELATKYDKQQLARMAQMGLVGAEDAVMAGLMIDRIAQTAMKPPTTTVAQDVLGPRPQMQQGPQGVVGLQQAPGAPQGPQAPTQGMAPPAMAAEGGLMQLAHGGSTGLAGLESNIPEMAGGGIVAFAAGGYGSNLPGGPMPQQPLNIPAQQTPEGIMAAQSNMDKLAGVNPNFFPEQQASLAQDRKDLAAEKEKAIGHGLFLFGAGLMGAREGQEWVKASESAQQALLQVAGAHGEIKKQESELKSASRALSAAQQQFAQNKSSSALAAITANQQRIEDAKNAQIAAKNVENQGYFKGFLELAKTDKEGFHSQAVALIKSKSESSTESERTIATLEKLQAAGDPVKLAQFLANFNTAKNNDPGAKEYLAIKGKDTFNMQTESDIKNVLATSKRVASEVNNPQVPGKAPVLGNATGGAKFLGFE